MSKWKCEICNSEFDNYQAQGFNGTIYCPLCYFKELYKREKTKNDKAIEELETIKQHYEELRKRPFEDSVFISDMLRQSFILSIKSYLELVLEILGDKENE